LNLDVNNIKGLTEFYGLQEFLRQYPGW